MFIRPPGHQMAISRSFAACTRTLSGHSIKPRAFHQSNARPLKGRHIKSKVQTSKGYDVPLILFSCIVGSALVIFNDFFLRTTPTPSQEADKTVFKIIHSEKDLYSLGGYSEVLDRVADLVRYLQDPAEYLASGATAPKGIILSGPPGVGKTHLAEAVAGHAGVACIMVGAGEVLQISVGATEQYLRELFKKAAEVAPCVICLDEIESIATRRVTETSSQNQIHMHYINSAINQLLTLLSADHPGVVVIATTNHYNLLDPAIVRPGRFDRHIALSLPNPVDRQQILEMHTKNKALASNVHLEDLVTLTAGFSGAKIAALANEAAIAAVRKKSFQINIAHFDEALVLLEEGVAVKSMADLPHKRLTAAHEAGHAVVGHLMGKKLYKVSILQSGAFLGRASWMPQEQALNLTEQEVLDEICSALAGRAAEILMGSPATGCKSDFKYAKNLANYIINKESMGKFLLGSHSETEQILQDQLKRAISLLQANRPAWEHLREALIERDQILREDFLNLMEGKALEDKENGLFCQTPKSRAAAVLPKSKRAAVEEALR